MAIGRDPPAGHRPAVPVASGRARRTAARGRPQVVPLTFIGVVIVAAFLAPLVHARAPCRSRAPSRSPRSTRRSGRPPPQTFTYRDRDYPRLPGAPRQRRRSRWPSSRRAATRASSSIRRTPTRSSVTLAGLVADARRRSGSRRPALGELRQRLERDQLSAAAVQHDRHRRDLDDRDDRLVRPRRLRIRPVPVPRPRLALPPRHRDDLPARSGDDHPDVHASSPSSAG